MPLLCLTCSTAGCLPQAAYWRGANPNMFCMLTSLNGQQREEGRSRCALKPQTYSLARAMKIEGAPGTARLWCHTGPWCHTGIPRQGLTTAGRRATCRGSAPVIRSRTHPEHQPHWLQRTTSRPCTPPESWINQGMSKCVLHKAGAWP